MTPKPNIVPTEEELDQMLGKAEKGILGRAKTDPTLFRPIMFSKNTAMFTVPFAIRDKAELVKIYNSNLGAIAHFDKKTNSIIFFLGHERPRKTKVIKTKK